MSLFFTVNSFGQDVGSSAVKGNFGIDGGVYSGLFEFQPNPNPGPNIQGANTDDWFKGATGLGVIDELTTNPHNPASNDIPNPMTNTAFQRRQSVWVPNELSDNIPFPVVTSNGTDYLWIDAVYGRDTYVKGGNAEKSYFAGSGDKNSDNPNTWSIGTAGSVPQKDDIIDVYAHLRGTNPHDPTTNTGFPLDDRPFDSLYVYTAASLVVTNGNKHLDFEYFRTGAKLEGNAIVNTGPNGGRTAWTFDADGIDDTLGNADDGSVAIPGTIIVSVDYINGGNVPSIRIRVWMSETTFNNYNNSLGGRPFNVDKTVAFEKGTGSGEFGYAAINPKTVGQYMWGRVNDDFATFEFSRTVGPPWGTWEGTTPTAVTSYTRYQFVEIGINLTAFGLDRKGEGDDCSTILGSLMVKTRSSGGGPNEGAFGSELKDFAGPYLFGFIGERPEITTAPLTSCESGSTGMATFTLNDGVTDAGGGTLSFYTDAAMTDLIPDGNAGLVGVQYTTGSRTIYVKSAIGTCVGTAQFDITVYDNPDFDVQDLSSCEDGTTQGASFNLNSAILAGADAGTVSFKVGGNVVASPYTAGLGETIITVRIANSNNANCYTEKTFKITVYDNPTCDISGEQTVCTGGSSIFTATAGMASYAWTGPEGFTATTQEITVSVAGIYEVTITDANGCSSKCSRELIVEGCGNGCTPGFWKTHPELWDSCSDGVVQAIPGDVCGAAGGEFTTGTGFVAYFGITNNTCGGSCKISNLPATMGAAMAAKGGDCKKLARTGVAALLNAAVFGDKYLDFLGYTSYAELYDAIKAGFNGCNYEPLATNLDNANNQSHDLCSGLPDTILTLQSAIAPKEVTTAKTEIAGFTAHPVPFKDQLTIKYNFDYKSDVKIEVFNSKKVLVFSMTDTDSYLNKEVTLNIDSSLEQEQVYIVKLTTDRGSSTKKVMSSSN